MVVVAEEQIKEGSIPVRLRREFRNPSMVTVLVAIIALLAIPLSILVPKWVVITQESFGYRAAAGEQRETALLPASALVSSHMLPWIRNEIRRLESAETPEEWNFTPFTEGPCDSTNLSDLPAGKYADAIASTCEGLLQIQREFSSDCRIETSCDVSTAALERLSSTRKTLNDTFAGAGFVSDYNAYDTRWTR